MGRRLWWQQEAVEPKREQQHPEVISWWEKQVSGIKRVRLVPKEKVNMAVPKGDRERGGAFRPFSSITRSPFLS